MNTTTYKVTAVYEHRERVTIYMGFSYSTALSVLRGISKLYEVHPGLYTDQMMEETTTRVLHGGTQNA